MIEPEALQACTPGSAASRLPDMTELNASTRTQVDRSLGEATRTPARKPSVQDREHCHSKREAAALSCLWEGVEG